MANRLKRRSISLAFLKICADSAAEALRDGSAVRKTDKRRRSQKAKQTKASERASEVEYGNATNAQSHVNVETGKLVSLGSRRAPRRRRVRCSNTSSELQGGAGAGGHYGQHDCKLFDPPSARLGGRETVGQRGMRDNVTQRWHMAPPEIKWVSCGQWEARAAATAALISSDSDVVASCKKRGGRGPT